MGADVPALSALVEPLLAGASATLARAVRAGLSADRLAPAFLVGYRAAVDALVPGLGGDGALAATEDGPLHPAAVTTRFEAGAVSGRKRFVTGVPGATRLVVLATAGSEGGRQRLVAAVVAVDAPGVEVVPMPALPFVPEVSHAEVTFTASPALRVVDGDGWIEVVRPFRTVEDLHVLGAVHGYLLGAAGRAGFDDGTVASLAGTLASFVALSAADPSAPAVHVALAGALDVFSATVNALTWPRAEPAEVSRWRRDLALLSVAGRAREARFRAALGKLGRGG